MSAASVFRVCNNGQPPRYLKMAQGAAVAALREEIARTRWLAHRGLRVPDILRVDDRAEQVTVLTAAMPGVAAEASLLPAPRLVEALARGLKRVHALPPAECPFDESLAARLSRAAAAVAAGEIDPDEFEPRNAGVAPEMLLARLMQDRPLEDIVVIHGDATLSNIFVDDGGGVGFIDCGNCGRGDRYADLAVLTAEIEEIYGLEAAKQFTRAYGAVWDSTKARYFGDLYELF